MSCACGRGDKHLCTLHRDPDEMAMQIEVLRTARKMAGESLGELAQRLIDDAQKSPRLPERSRLLMLSRKLDAIMMMYFRPMGKTDA